MESLSLADKVAEILLAELKLNNPLAWFYISQANDDGFIGGYLIQARGPAEAWGLFHRLRFYAQGVGAETMTMGPLEEESMKKVPESFRWRKLSKEEAENLGKE